MREPGGGVADGNRCKATDAHSRGRTGVERSTPPLDRRSSTGAVRGWLAIRIPSAQVSQGTSTSTSR
jgi:hypothetical protein